MSRFRPWILALLSAAACRTPEAAADQTAAAAPVLVELFTSEGCSSCPPADAALARLSSDRVIALSWHVDYWNELGWPDPFSSSAGTARQHAYARALGGGTYTPEMIVAGREAFVGSNESRARQAISAAQARPARATISAAAERNGDRVIVRYGASGALDDASVGLALAESRVAVQVPRGENAGRRLEHVQVVRAAKSVPAAAGEAQAELTVPSGMGAGSVVVYLQHRTSLEVLAVTRAPLR